jgi:hypothetical protein
MPTLRRHDEVFANIYAHFTTLLLKVAPGQKETVTITLERAADLHGCIRGVGKPTIQRVDGLRPKDERLAKKGEPPPESGDVDAAGRSSLPLIFRAFILEAISNDTN